MSAGEIAILGVYAIGYLITYFHLRTENQSLKNIMNAMSQYMGVFDPEKVKGYVKIMEERIEAEKGKAAEEAITKAVGEAEEDKDYYLGVTVGLMQLLDRLSVPLLDTKIYENAMRGVENEEAKRLYRKIVVERIKAKWKERGITKAMQVGYLRWLATSLEACPLESEHEKKIG